MNSENLKKFFFIFQSINIVAIPFLLITGPFLSDLSLSLCALSYIFYVLIKKQTNSFKNIFFIFFLIFYLVIVLSSTLSENVIFSLHSSLPYIRFGLFILCVWHTSKEDKDLFYKIFIILSIIYLILIVDGYIQFITGKNIFNYEKVGIRVSSFFGDELILGSYAARFFPIYIGLYLYINRLRSNNNIEKIFFILFLILITLLVIISGERTAFLLLTLSIIIMFFFLKGLKRLKIYFLIIFIFVSTIFILINQKNFERLIIETKDQIVVDNKILFFGERRHEYAKVSINIFKDNIYLGSGPKTYRIQSKNENYAISELSWNTHPHSIYFQLLAETGLIGTLLVIFTFIYFLIILFRESFIKTINNNYLYSSSNIKICILTAIIINIFPLIPSGNFFNNWISIIYYYPVSLFFAIKERFKN